MTLSRQLIVLIIGLLLLVFAGTFIISIENTRDYLIQQLESHAQDTATSLGLSVSPHLTGEDLAMVTSMTDAIFDRGFYQLIRVENMQGEALVERSVAVSLEGIPQWFVSGFPLHTPRGEATLMSGWMQAGRVVVQSHPGYAHRQLWENAVETFWWFLVSALVVLLIGMILLRLVLRPLKSIEWQAESICNREFPIVERMPRTPDFRRIIDAMNRMSTKVRQMLDDLEKLADGLRHQAYQHPVTGLFNKRYFFDYMASRWESPEGISQGALCLVQLKDFKGYNDRRGYQAGDELLKETAKRLQTVADLLPRHLLGHLAGADFALLVEECALEQADTLGEQLSVALNGLYASGKLDEPDAGHIGISYFDRNSSVSEIFADADMALKAAQVMGANQWVFRDSRETGKEQVQGASYWREFIELALSEGRVRLNLQPVFSVPDRRLMHREVLVRIAEAADAGESDLISAGIFMPQAESLGLVSAIDKAVVSQAVHLLESEASDSGHLAVNLSPSSLKDEDFLGWLEQELAAHREVSGRLIFEMPEYGVIPLMELAKAFIERIGRHGSRFSLDHFGRSFSSFAYLRSLKIHYLKVDGSFIRSLEENSNNRFFVQTLAEIAHGLDVAVIAESVESEAVWSLLPKLQIDGGQGYHLGRPK